MQCKLSYPISVQQNTLSNQVECKSVLDKCLSKRFVKWTQVSIDMKELQNIRLQNNMSD